MEADVVRIVLLLGRLPESRQKAARKLAAFLGMPAASEYLSLARKLAVFPRNAAGKPPANRRRAVGKRTKERNIRR